MKNNICMHLSILFSLTFFHMHGRYLINNLDWNIRVELPDYADRPRVQVDVGKKGRLDIGNRVMDQIIVNGANFSSWVGQDGTPRKLQEKQGDILYTMSPYVENGRELNGAHLE